MQERNELQIPDQDALAANSKQVLGWGELCAALSERAVSETGRALCRDLPLARSKTQAEDLLADTAEMVDLIQQGATPPLSAFNDLAKAVELGADELKEVTDVPGMGSFAVIKDPQGTVIAFWQAMVPVGVSD